MAANLTFAVQRPLFGKEITVSTGMLWAIFWIGAGSFVPLLFLQYVGEEAIYPIIAQEMWANKQFIVTTLYGHNLGRPGLYSWLILLPTSVLGEQNILVAARLVTVCSTVLIGLILAWLVRKIFNDRLLSAFAAAVFLSGDVLLYRGWLAYVDPLFSLFTFAAMACLWVATEQRRRDLLIVAALCLICAFLAKAVTGYVFYGVLGLVLLWRHENRRFLLAPLSILLHLGAAAFPFFWNYGLANDAVSAGMKYDVMHQLQNAAIPNALTYVELFIAYPFRTIWYLLPASAIAIYCLASRRIPAAALRRNPLLIAGFAVAINLVPYWLCPAGSTRYLMPLYPLFALLMAYVVFNSGKLMIDLCAKALIATVIVAYLAALIGFPLYEHFIRGSYDNAAQAIIARAANFPLYAADSTSVGLSIVADINTRRRQAPPVTGPPAEFSSGFVLSLHPDPAIGQIDTTFAVGHNPNGSRTRYLLCRGSACSTGGNPSDKSWSF